MPSVRYWNGSQYAVLPNGERIEAWNGPSLGYRPISEARYWNGATWVPFYTKSNPGTFEFYPTLTTNLRWTSFTPPYDGPGTHPDNTSADLYVGRYGGSFPYHYTSILKFDAVSNWGLTLAQHMAERPVVKGCYIRLTRMPGGLASPVGFLRIGTWKQLDMQNLPATNPLPHDWDPHAAIKVDGWGHHQSKLFPFYPQNIYDLRDGYSLMFSEILDGYTVAGPTTPAYSRIYGRGNAPSLDQVPRLTVHLDVV